MRLAVRLGLGFTLTAFVLATLVLVGGGGVDVYVVLLLVALMALRELLAAQASQDQRARMGVFVFAGMLAFVFIVVQRVREILKV